jgi:hypothetical protein
MVHGTAIGSGLAEKLTALSGELDEAERANLKLLLGMAAGGLVANGVVPREGVEALAFDAAISSISRLQPHRHRIPRNGIAFRGRPEFLNDELLGKLQAESAALRPTAFRFDDHFVVSGAPTARNVAFSRELNDFIAAHADHVTPTAKANYLYYDEVGLGIDPHVDNESFALNAILMLEHVWQSKRSALVVYPPNNEPERLYLAPGEMVVMFADSTVHARERMSEGERVRIVGFGFQPLLK